MTQIEEKTIVGPEGSDIKVPMGLRVGIRTVRRPKKHYRLMWMSRGEAWMAHEDLTQYKRKFGGRNGRVNAVSMGQALAESVGAGFSDQAR